MTENNKNNRQKDGDFSKNTIFCLPFNHKCVPLQADNERQITIRSTNENEFITL